MKEEKNLIKENIENKKEMNNLKVELEVYEVTTSTVLESLGASLSKNSCSSVIIVPS